MAPAPWQEILTGADVLAITLIVGNLTALFWLLRSRVAAGALQTSVERRLHRFLGCALALLTLTSAAILLARSLTMSGAPLPQMGRIIPLVLMHTDFGRVWFARAAAVLLLWLGWSLWRPKGGKPKATLWLLLIPIAVVAFTRSATGHAGDHGDFQLPVWMDWLHLLAAGLWGGTIVVFVLNLAVPLHRHLDRHPDYIAGVVRRFSAASAAGLVLVVATGIYNAWHMLGGWQPLWTSRYGLILDVKSGLVILMAVFGASNCFRNTPRLVAAAQKLLGQRLPRASRSLVFAASAEALLMLAILAVVALLLHAMPPDTAAPMP